jgi:hypothetical protein
MNSRPSAWASSQFYRRTEWETNCRENLKAGKQELGHGKQRRLKAQYLWDIPEPDTVSKSAQSAPDSCFQNASVPRRHSAVISKTPVCHIITRLLPPKWLTRPVLTRLLFLKHRCCHQSLDISSKVPMMSSVAQHLPLKYR